MRRAEADDRPAADQARPRIGERFVDRAADVIGVEPVALNNMPFRGLVARDHIFVARQLGRAVDGDAVVVPKDVQPAELQVAGETHGFVVHPLHQAAVAGDCEGAMIDELVAVNGVQMPLGDRHSDRHRHALSQAVRS